MNDQEIQRRTTKILLDYADSVFRTTVFKDRPIRGPFGEATIELKPGAQPTKQRPYHIQGERREAWTKLVNKLIEDGKLEDGVSAWSSPSFPVPKKKPGEYRFVVDYRAVNDATVTDAHPLPRIEDLLQKQGQYRVWTVLDMKDGYHQVPLKKEHRHITCMSTPQGTKQWTVLVMGLKYGGAIFQRMMEWILRGIECVCVYVDDVIIGSNGETSEQLIQNHERDVRIVLDRLKENAMIVDPKKAHFFTTEVEFCGHVLKEGRRLPAPGKLLSIQKWELPKTVTQLRGFLGLANYYSSYVNHYAEFAGPLMSKLQLNRQDGKKGSQKPLVWKESEKEVFYKLKEILAHNLELFQVDPDQPFILRTDASDKAIGAVLEQQKETTQGKLEWVPVGFYSRKLAKGQINWTPREKETYAVVSALRKWAGWVGLQPILVLTDHRSLEDWVREKMDTPSGPAGRRARWHETLSKFDLTIQYMPGEDNIVADAMSRFAYPACKAFQDSSFHGNEESREEMKRIIADEIAEGRMVGVITTKMGKQTSQILVGGHLSRRLREKENQIWPITRGGKATSGDSPQKKREEGEHASMSKSPVQPDHDCIQVDEFGNEISAPSKTKWKGKMALSTHENLIPVEFQQKKNDVESENSDESLESAKHFSEPSFVDKPFAPLENPTPTFESSTPKLVKDQGVVHPLNKWESAYHDSLWWGKKWQATQVPNEKWPEDVRIFQDKMLWDGRICIPENLVEEVIREQHVYMGHIGIQRLANEVKRRYALPGQVKLLEVVRDVRRRCAICQACEPPNWNTSLPIRYTPVPTHIMTSVALDVFAMPNVKWQGIMYDQILLCVDRLSGWVIARPCQKLGLTAEKAAHLILENGWETFGIPSIITSDRGAQFVGQWWKTMCARLGIRQAYSQAYRPQANGRAEVAGKTLIQTLRKIWIHEKINWVEALPRVLRIYHDKPGETVVSPFQIVFGRERNLAGVPYTPPKDCEEAQAFFTRMEALDLQLSKVLNEKHKAAEEKSNKNRSCPLPFQVGDWAWVLRSRGSQASKLDTWWTGPVKVLRRVGECSYEVLLKPGIVQDVHQDQMKRYVEDVAGEALELFHFQPEYHPMDTTSEHFTVEKVLRHKVEPDGALKFLTKWEGYEENEATWEPAENFFLHYCFEFIQYLKQNNLKVDMSENLRATPTDQDLIPQIRH